MPEYIIHLKSVRVTAKSEKEAKKRTLDKISSLGDLIIEDVEKEDTI